MNNDDDGDDDDDDDDDYYYYYNLLLSKSHVIAFSVLCLDLTILQNMGIPF